VFLKGRMTLKQELPRKKRIPIKFSSLERKKEVALSFSFSASK
jgi:hypothetical protein